MTSSHKKLLALTELRERNINLLSQAMSEDEGVIGLIIRIHLATEYLLEELTRVVLQENADHVFAVGLSYSQKLELASRLEPITELKLLPEHVIGSLRKLNKLRNRVAHKFNEPVSPIEIKELFLGLEKDLPYPEVTELGMAVALKRYFAFIYGNMLPKYVEFDNET